ncbi:YjgN family protein [Nisaea sp.]|uniref:YjgN family protein n=1 Tax=Nisaea sp. TaxID=2024842 RepID=UPI003B51A196
MTFESSGAGSLGPTGEKELATHKLSFDTTGAGGLIGLHVVNLIFMALTLMVYRFWALTRVRRAVWPRMRLDGSPLEYAGTGLEIFLGFLKVFILILLPYLFASNWINANVLDPQLGLDPAFFALYLLLGIGAVFLLSAARFLAYRYRVNRTQWRGIRGSVGGAAYLYGVRVLVCYFLILISLGVLKPWADIRIQQYRIEHTKFGGRPLAFEATARGLWLPYLVFLAFYLGFLGCFLVPYLTLFGEVIAASLSGNPDTTTLELNTKNINHAAIDISFGLAFVFALCAGLAYLNYLVVFWKNVVGKIRFGRARFSFQPTRWQVFCLFLGNALIVNLTFWLLLPIAWLRKGKFLARHLVILGELDEDELVQAEFDTGTTGEGFLGDFDLA